MKYTKVIRKSEYFTNLVLSLFLHGLDVATDFA